MNINVELNQKVFYFTHSNNDDDFVIKEAEVGRICICEDIVSEDYEPWGDVDISNFIELKDCTAFDIIILDNHNYIVEQSNAYGTMAFTKEEAERLVEEKRNDPNTARSLYEAKHKKNEIAELKRLLEKYPEYKGE